MQGDKKKVFVSYSHENAGWLDTISRMLRGLQTSEIIEPFDDRLIAIGQEWDATIKAKLDEADLVILIVTFDFLGSTYINQVEIDRALQQHKENRTRLLPIIAEECHWERQKWAKIDAWPTKDSRVLPLDKWADQNEALKQISEAICKWAETWRPVRRAGDEPPPADPTTPPYRGLSPFEPKHEADFFGREALTDTLWTGVCTNSLTLLTGASGSGKSSLVNAGIIPRLKRQGGWCIVRSRPGQRPIDNLAIALTTSGCAASTAAGPPPAWERLSEELLDGPTAILAWAGRRHRQLGDRLFLVLDQFEETFNLAKTKNPAQHEALIDLLLAISRGPETSPVTALLALRADFMTAFQDDRPELVEALQPATVMMRRMKPEEWAAAIEEPARRRSVTVEPALLATLVNEVARNPDALPLLEATLETLWSSRKSDTLTLDAYEQQGGLAGALASRGEAALADPAIDEATVRRLFLELVHVDPKGGIDNVTRQPRSRTHLDSLDPGLWDLGRTLAAEQHRLLVTSRDDTTGTETLDIIHESLFRQWSRLKEWIEERQNVLLFVQRLDQSIAEYYSNNQKASYLLRYDETLLAKQLILQHPDLFRGLRSDFITTSQTHWVSEDAIKKSNIIWSQLDFRLSHFEGRMLPQEHLLFCNLACLNLLERIHFVRDAALNEIYATKFIREPDILLRCTIGLDPENGACFADFATLSNIAECESNLLFTRLAIACHLAPLLPDLAAPLFDIALPIALKPANPDSPNPPIVLQAIQFAVHYIDNERLLRALDQSVCAIISATDPYELFHSLKIFLAMAPRCDVAIIREKVVLLLSLPISGDQHLLKQHIKPIFSDLSRTHHGIVDGFLLSKLIDCIEVDGSPDYFDSVAYCIDLYIERQSKMKPDPYMDRILSIFLDWSIKMEQFCPLAEFITAYSDRFGSFALVDSSTKLFERAALIAQSTSDSRKMNLIIHDIRLKIC